MRKHTPGPWKYEPNKDIFRSQVLFVDEGNIGPAVLASYHQHEKGNGFLIAAAPEMLEALKFCQKWFEKWSPTADMIEGKVGELPMLTSVKSVIAKAEGSKS